MDLLAMQKSLFSLDEKESAHGSDGLNGFMKVILLKSKFPYLKKSVKNPFNPKINGQ